MKRDLTDFERMTCLRSVTNLLIYEVGRQRRNLTVEQFKVGPLPAKEIQKPFTKIDYLNPVFHLQFIYQHLGSWDSFKSFLKRHFAAFQPTFKVHRNQESLFFLFNTRATNVLKEYRECSDEYFTKQEIAKLYFASSALYELFSALFETHMGIRDERICVGYKVLCNQIRMSLEYLAAPKGSPFIEVKRMFVPPYEDLREVFDDINDLDEATAFPHKVADMRKFRNLVENYWLKKNAPTVEDPRFKPAMERLYRDIEDYRSKMIRVAERLLHPKKSSSRQGEYTANAAVNTTAGKRVICDEESGRITCGGIIPYEPTGGIGVMFRVLLKNRRIIDEHENVKRKGRPVHHTCLSVGIKTKCLPECMVRDNIRTFRETFTRLGLSCSIPPAKDGKYLLIVTE